MAESGLERLAPEPLSSVEPADAGTPPVSNARRERIATALAAAVVVLSIWLRVLIRGRYYAGWDIVLSTNGAFLAATKSWRELMDLALDVTARASLSVAPYTVLGTILPGYLSHRWPWEYWGDLVTFLLVTATFWLVAIALELPWRRRWPVLLAWAASPPLLSFALVGFPWGSVFLPYAFAFVAILRPSVRRSWLLTPLLCAAAIASAWQVYDLGKTVFVAFLAAAFLVRNVPLLTRLVWLAVGGFQLHAVVTNPSAPTQAFLATRPDGPWPVIQAVGKLGLQLVTPMGVDLPFLLLAAGIALVAGVRRDRLFLASQLLVHLGLVLIVTMSAPGELRPRRFLAVGYCAVVIVGAAFRADSPVRARTAIVAVLVAGVAAQLANIATFAHWPRPRADYPLPYSHSEADYMVPRPPIDWAARMSDDVLAGDTLVVVYGRFAYDENATNPTEVLERVYLHVGHERFVQQVRVYGSMPCGFACLPLRAVADAERDLAALAADPSIGPRRLRLYYSQDLHLTYEHTFEVESAAVFGAVRRHFALRDAQVLGPKLLQFRLVPRPTGSSEAFTVAGTTVELARSSSATGDRTKPRPSSLPFEHYWVVDEPRPPRSPAVEARPWGTEAVRVFFSTIVHVADAGRFEIILGADEPATLHLDGRPLLVTPAGGFRIEQASPALAAGDHRLEVVYDDAGGVAHLLVDVHREGDGAAP